MSLTKSQFSKRNIIIGVGIFCVASLVVAFALKSIRTNSLTQTPKAAPEPIGRIAIILDDWGYNSKGCAFLEKIDIPVAVSILPELHYSQDMARCAHQNNKEVMLHLPLEPHKFSETYPDGYVILSSMTKDEVFAHLDKFFKNIPFVVGANNHMGSKATENRELMKTIFSYLHKNNFFFIDSLVSSDSICESVAQGEGVSFLRRNVFLDNEANSEYIKGQLDQLAKRARKYGFALGIGHDRPLTQKALLEYGQEMKNQGFDFVTVKELIDYAKKK
ncbi:MAG: divergent polysaccharide deacetylase family protein [Candidatus Aceula meridiana]|nr:divergent polysaccharide deacetylase family protein [Candidatus Aceula meridiana]